MIGILKIAFKLLVNDRGKFAALLTGITFAVFLMVQLTSVFAGILSKASATIINVGASVWVMDPAINNPLNSLQLPRYIPGSPWSNSTTASTSRPPCWGWMTPAWWAGLN